MSKTLVAALDPKHQCPASSDMTAFKGRAGTPAVRSIRRA
jgi:hypothetical protein